MPKMAYITIITHFAISQADLLLIFSIMVQSDPFMLGGAAALLPTLSVKNLCTAG